MPDFLIDADSRDLLGNATLVHAGVLGFDEDVAVVAKALRVPVADLAPLKPLEWIERDKLSGEPRRGKLKVQTARINRPGAAHGTSQPVRH